MPSPSGAHVARDLVARVRGPVDEEVSERQERVQYTLPPAGGEGDDEAKQRVDRHRRREQLAIERLNDAPEKEAAAAAEKAAKAEAAAAVKAEKEAAATAEKAAKAEAEKAVKAEAAAAAKAEKEAAKAPGTLVTFSAGPLGVGLKPSPDGVRISSVDPAQQAAKQAVTVGMLVLKIGERSVAGLDLAAVTDAIKKSDRPFTMLLAAAADGA